MANFTDVKPDKASKLDIDGDSVVSFASGPVVASQKLVKFAWGPNDRVRPGFVFWTCFDLQQASLKLRHHPQINHEQFHRMLDEYREAKRRELDLELKAKQSVPSTLLPLQY